MKIRVMEHLLGTNTDHIEKLFSTVSEVKKKKSKNIVYVIMPYEQQARKAIRSLNGTKLLRQKIRVEEFLSEIFDRKCS